MNSYETMLVVSAKQEEQAIKDLVAKFTSIIEKSGTLEKVDEWGKKKLAYPINDEPDGIYFLITFKSNPDLPAELERVYHITDGLLRTIIIAK